MVTTKQPREPRASLLVEQWAKQTFAILTIENLNSDNHSYMTINCDTGQHSQFLRCLCRTMIFSINGCQSCSVLKTSQELRMLSSVTINCQVRMIVWIQVLNCQNCNQCLKCQVSSTVFPIVRVKNEGKKWNKIVINTYICHFCWVKNRCYYIMNVWRSL